MTNNIDPKVFVRPGPTGIAFGGRTVIFELKFPKGDNLVEFSHKVNDLAYGPHRRMNMMGTSDIPLVGSSVSSSILTRAYRRYPSAF